MQLSDLHPLIGTMHKLTGDLYYAGAEYLTALGQLDAEAYDDLRAHFDDGRFNEALATIEQILREVDASVGVDTDEAAKIGRRLRRRG